MGAQVFNRSDDYNQRVSDSSQQSDGDIVLGELNGKAIISASDGARIGNVQDILIDPTAMHVAGFVVSSGGLFGRDEAFVSASDVQAWGKDAILINKPEVVSSKKDLPGRESWFNLAGQLKGRSIVSSSGEKLGNVDDLLIDSKGQVVAYQISDSPFSQRRRIDATGTRTMGGDVIIIDK
jgi:uncharacterized protein YrrD